MYDVIILGSGPAGYTAALYTSRAFLKTLVLAGTAPGGQLTTTTDVDNFPGFAQGIQGPLLMEEMKKQAERFGTEIIDKVCTRLSFPRKRESREDGSRVKPGMTEHAEPFTAAAGDEIFEGRSVIVATGAQAMYLGLPSEQKFMGKGVSACATCDGFFFRGKEVVVVGGGDTAMEEATFLTKFASKVTIIHRREEFRASAIMLDRAKKDPKITILTNKIIEEVLGDVSVTGVRMKDAVSGEVTDYSTQGFFLAIGHKPSTEFLKGVVDLDLKGYILTKRPQSPLEAQTATSVPGIFASGDCVDSRYRQAIVAAGQGCMAAMDVEHWLSQQNG